ncbi:MAG: hypothetical protein JNM96_07570, partial [Bacteroidia bacterium]|nr:hypothetical protein [Bacteroidia bacterium]
MNKIKLSLVFAATLALNVVAQKITSKSGDIFGTRVFIENKGQFDALAVSEAKIKYALENGNEKIYFNDNGLTYVMIKRYPLTQEQREEKEKGKPVFVRPNEVYKVHMNWLNCNKNIQIVESEKQHHYFTYGGPELNSNCFKKITYLNVYNNIDIEYFIPEDKSSGIKYNVVLHPGAKPSQIKIAYTGNVNSINVSDNGNVEIKTPLEPIIEHKPVSFQNNNSLATGFTINDGIIGFKIEDKYNSNSELVIDPWVTNISSLNPNNCGYDVDFDFNGNLFVYGGGTVCMVAKYNNLGVLQWTFPGTVA